MKKLFCLVALVLITCCIFASCNKDPDKDKNPIPEHTHAFGEWETVIEPTCVANGLKERICSCDEKESEIIPATGIHTEFTLEAVAPSCIESGLTEGKKCSVCDAIIVEQQTVAALGHDEYMYTEKDENCKVFNITACRRCDYIDRVDTGIVNHVFGEWILLDTDVEGSPCGIDKIYERTCEDCGATEQKTEAASGHNYTQTVISVHKYDSVSGVESIGEIKYECQNSGCDSSYSEYENHEYTESVTSPTCTEQGYTTYSCYCGHSYVSDYTDALGHSFTSYEPVMPPDDVCICEWIPLNIAYCDHKCGETHVITIGASMGHSYTSWSVAVDPTEESEGLLTRECERCKCHSSEIILPTLTQENVDNGTYTLTIVDATYEQEGSKTFTYEIDGQTFSWIITIPVMEYPYSKGLEFVSNGDGTCYVAGIGTCTDTDIVIPPTSPDGDKVTSIGKEAFRGCDRLTSIKIPSSVTSIGESAFHSCKSLKSVTFAEGSQLTSIGLYVFDQCSSLTSIEIPESVTFISPYRNSLFSGCSSLTEIKVAEGNTCYKDIDGNLYNYDGTALIYYAIGKTDTNFAVPDGVTSILYGAFADCTSLTSIEIPESVTFIGEAAFYDCTSLTSIEIPMSVTSISDTMFYNCSSLTSIEIPASVASIGRGAFSFCTSLTSIKIPASVTMIYEEAFSRCRALTTVIFAEGSQIHYFSNSLFYECKSLTSIDIPESVTFICKSAFGSCTSLTDVYYGGTEEEWAAISIDSLNDSLKNATIHYNYDPAE